MAYVSGTVKGVRRNGTTTVVALAGKVDLYNSPEVHKALVVACQEQPKILVVNLSSVSYLDSSGIGTLVDVFRRVNAFGGKLVLCGLNDRVYSLFEITKLDTFFKICGTEVEALSA